MKVYSTKQAAVIFGVSFSTIKNWIRSGKLNTFLTPTKQHRITQTEIDRIMGSSIKCDAILVTIYSPQQREGLLKYCSENGLTIIVDP